MTTYSTLVGVGQLDGSEEKSIHSESNFFSRLLNPKYSPSKVWRCNKLRFVAMDENGYYFIDRDGKYFEPILEYLRTGMQYICFISQNEESSLFQVICLGRLLQEKLIFMASTFHSSHIRFEPIPFLGICFSKPILNSIRATGIYIDEDGSFLVFGVDGKGYSSQYHKEFEWKSEYPRINISFHEKSSFVLCTN